MTNERKCISTKEAAEYLGVAAATLTSWRMRKENLPYIKLGSRVLYRIADLDKYLEKHLVPAEER